MIIDGLRHFTGAATKAAWLTALEDKKKELTLRLLQILLDPRVSQKPVVGQALPRLESNAISADLVRNPQMVLCLLIADLIRGRPPAVLRNSWRTLALGDEWRPGESNRVVINEPGTLLNFLSQYSSSVASRRAVYDFLNLRQMRATPTGTTTNLAPKGHPTSQPS